MTTYSCLKCSCGLHFGSIFVTPYHNLPTISWHCPILHCFTLPILLMWGCWKGSWCNASHLYCLSEYKKNRIKDTGVKFSKKWIKNQFTIPVYRISFAILHADLCKAMTRQNCIISKPNFSAHDFGHYAKVATLGSLFFVAHLEVLMKIQIFILV